MIVPAAVWPRAHAATAAWNVRLGRVIHWIGAALGLACIVAGVALFIPDYLDHRREEAALAAWNIERTHYRHFEVTNPLGRKYEVDADKTSKQNDIEDLVSSYTASKPWNDVAPNPEAPVEVIPPVAPVVYNLPDDSLWLGFGAGLILAMAGRTARYLLAGE